MDNDCQWCGLYKGKSYIVKDVWTQRKFIIPKEDDLNGTVEKTLAAVKRLRLQTRHGRKNISSQGARSSRARKSGNRLPAIDTLIFPHTVEELTDNKNVHQEIHCKKGTLKIREVQNIQWMR